MEIPWLEPPRERHVHQLLGVAARMAVQAGVKAGVLRVVEVVEGVEVAAFGQGVLKTANARDSPAARATLCLLRIIPIRRCDFQWGGRPCGRSGVAMSLPSGLALPANDGRRVSHFALEYFCPLGPSTLVLRPPAYWTVGVGHGTREPRNPRRRLGHRCVRRGKKP